MREKGLGRVFPEGPFAVYAFLRTGLMLRSPAEEAEPPQLLRQGRKRGLRAGCLQGW